MNRITAALAAILAAALLSLAPSAAHAGERGSDCGYTCTPPPDVVQYKRVPPCAPGRIVPVLARHASYYFLGAQGATIGTDPVVWQLGPWSKWRITWITCPGGDWGDPL